MVNKEQYLSDIIQLADICREKVAEIKLNCPHRVNLFLYINNYYNIVRSRKNAVIAMCEGGLLINDIIRELKYVFNNDNISILDSHICRELYICTYIITLRGKDIMSYE